MSPDEKSPQAPVGPEPRAGLFDPGIFRRLAELSPDAMIAHAGSKIIWANAAAATLLGAADPAAMLGFPVMKLVAPHTVDMVEQRLRRMAATGEGVPLVEETLLRLDDGRPVEVEVVAAPVGGGVTLVAARDMTARREAERARRSAESQARAFFEASSEALGISVRGVHVEVNAAYARLFGFDRPEELVGTSVLDLVAPEHHATLKEKVRRRAQGLEGPATYDLWARRRDGSAFRIELRVSGFQAGGDVYTVVVALDVTAQREYAARLGDSERRYRELVDQVPVGVWEEDLSGAKRIIDGVRAAGVKDLAAHFRAHPEDALACARAIRVLDVNSTACRMLGASDKAQLLANLHRVFQPVSAEDVALELVHLAEGRPGVTEGWNGTLDGGRRWMAVRAVLAAGHEEDWSRVLVSTSDMTELLQAREERALLQDRLRHAEKLEAVGRLAGGVAHDFNNILAAILGFAELSIEETRPGTALHESQLQIREAARRARDLVKQILTFGRRDMPEPQPIDLAAVVGEALRLARAAIPATVEVEARLDPAAGVVLADRVQVHQIVLNLCSNARDAVGTSGRIEVSVVPVEVGAEVPELAPGPYVRIRVRDDGVGMDEATRSRLFEPYMSTKSAQGGHGLGLAVVHGIVIGAGGAVQVQSAPGRGSTFDVYLPRLAAASAALPVSSPAALQVGQERILLVDDEPLVLTAHRRLLQSLGYQVTVASNGAEALSLLGRGLGEFDLLISDQSMPGLSGFQLARTVRQERPDLPVLLCTGYSDAVDEATARAIGVRGLLQKPIDRAQLSAAVRQALGSEPP